MESLKFENCAFLLDAINIPVFVHDKDYRITYANESFCKIIGQPLSRCLEKYYWDILPIVTKAPHCSCVNSSRVHIEFIKSPLHIAGKFYQQNLFQMQDKIDGHLCYIHVWQDITEIEHEKTLLAMANKNLENSLKQCIEAVVHMVEQHDLYTSMHQYRAANLAKMIAKKLGLNHETTQGIHFAGLIHDIGKIHIPIYILTAPRKLADAEYELIKKHSVIGFEIVKDMPFHWPISTIILQHHEKLDGTGYPYGIEGDDILLETRITTVADVFEAMCSHRPYRMSKSEDKAQQVLQDGAGSAFDKDIVAVCLDLVKSENFDLDASRFLSSN